MGIESKDYSAATRWTELDNDRKQLLSRCEQYARYTIPNLLLPEGREPDKHGSPHEFQSLGAQVVNHLANKLVLALFAPSRPFFRLDPKQEMLDQIAEANPNQQKEQQAQLQNMLAQAERQAVQILDRRAIRPKMYDAMKQIVVTGNALMVMGKENMRVLSLRNYVVQRGVEGEQLELMTMEEVRVEELDPLIRAELGNKVRPGIDDRVKLYRWIVRKDTGKYEMTTWVDEHKIMHTSFQGRWAEADLPYRAITWELSSGANYGTGLVENYDGDFNALTMLSASTVAAAILASEFRWLVNPGGITSVEDFERSENGAALPGVKDDIQLVQSGVNNTLQTNIQIAQIYINRIGQGFLLQSAVTRQAERVTKEEILRNAEELETGLGGAYSRIAVDVQVPMAYWLLDMAKLSIKGKAIEPTIITGLAALSRSGDRENLMLFLSDMTNLAAIPPIILGRLRINRIQQEFASARGLSVDEFLLSEEEYAKVQQAEEQRAAQQQAIAAGINAGAQQGAQPNG